MDSSKDIGEWTSLIKAFRDGEFGGDEEWQDTELAKRIFNAIRRTSEANAHNENLLVKLAAQLANVIESHRNEMVGTDAELEKVDVLMKLAELTLMGFEVEA